MPVIVMLIAKYIGDDFSYEHHIGRNKPPNRHQ